MKYNKITILNLATPKFGPMITNLIATEVFSNALPFDEAMINEKSRELYVFALESMHRTNRDLLKDALGRKDLTKGQKLLLESFNGIRNDLLEDICARIAVEAEKPDAKPLNEIIDKMSMTQEEMRKVANKSRDELSLDEISNIIKDKVIANIKNEKEAYDKSEAIKEEIKEEIEDVVTAESFIANHTNPTEPQNHVSMFSKINDIMMDELTHSTESFEDPDLPFGIMTKVMNNRLFGNLKSPKPVMESCVESFTKLNAYSFADHSKNVSGTALASTIIIDTLLESLHTMSLIDIKKDEMKSFIDSKFTPITLESAEEVFKKAKEELAGDISDLKKDPSDDKYECLKNKIGQLMDLLAPLKGKIGNIDGMQKALSDANDDVSDIYVEGKNANSANLIPSTEDNTAMNNNIAQIEGLERMVRNHLNYKTMTINFRGLGNTPVVVFRDSNNNIVGNSRIVVSFAKGETRSVREIVNELINKRALNDRIQVSYID